MKKPLMPTRWARRWLAARSWARARRQDEVGEVDAAFGGDEGGAERPEDPVVRGGLAPRVGSEAVDDVEGVQLGQAHPGSPFAGEADVGHLCGGEHPVVVE